MIFAHDMGSTSWTWY